MDKTYIHTKYEDVIYSRWEASGLFSPSETGEPFTIIMPPPNANGDLHLGHALILTIQDIMIRSARASGRAALWLPGTDHAGFETQVVYEKKMAKEGRSRFDMSREQLYDEILAFTEQNRRNMERQIRKMGASCDWSRNTFTLDERVIKTVHATFKKLHADGLIYRGVRLVNYSPKFGTTFSDLEVVHEERQGVLSHIMYEFVSGPQKGQKGIVVATTRPETLLGDQAVAVHPDDERYRHLVGQQVKLPLCNRTIPIIADAAVESKFGTGAVKVTPAHDFVDFEIGTRHKLPLLQIIGFDGKITAAAPVPYRGLKAATEGRERVLADLTAANLLVKEEPHHHTVPMGYKGGAIEPLPREQWFVKMADFAARVRDLIESGAITINPPRYQKILFNWLDNIRDWPLSRQLAWGIPIPAWFCEKEGCAPVVTAGQAPPKCPTCGGPLTADPDTFDTWFSSGQWVYATLGYDVAAGHPSPDFDRFAPTSVMETAADIIFFWVARMIFLTDYVTGRIPFKHIYLNGLVLDSHGQKMSKSRGNVVNPIEMVEKYGADALRLALVVGNTPGGNQSFQEDKVRAMRNFTNKLWNMGRFIETRLGEGQLPAALAAVTADAVPPPASTSADRAIFESLAALKVRYQKLMSREQFNLVAESLYQFAWHDFADVYIEAAKNQSDHQTTDAVLLYVYRQLLHLLEPFAPFIVAAIIDSELK